MALRQPGAGAPRMWGQGLHVHGVRLWEQHYLCQSLAYSPEARDGNVLVASGFRLDVRAGRQVLEQVFWQVFWQVEVGLGELVADAPGEVVGHVGTGIGQDSAGFDVVLAVGETAQQSERHLACRVVQAQVGSANEVVQLRLEQLVEDLAGRFVHVDISSPSDPPGAVRQLVGVGLPKRPFDVLGHLVCVNGRQSRDGEAFGFRCHFWVGYEQLAEQLAALVGREPVEGGSARTPRK